MKLRNNNMIFLLLLIISTLFMGIGYASINSITGDITGTAIAELQDGIFIADVQNVGNIEADLDASEIIYYFGTMMHSKIVLSNTNPNSEIEYKVTVYNNSNNIATFLEVEYSEEYYDNLGIYFEISGFNIGEEIAPKETKDIIIKFKYKDNVLQESNILNSYLNFKFGLPSRLMFANTNFQTYLNSGIKEDKIETIKFTLRNAPTQQIIAKFDASEQQNETIIGYYTDIDNNNLYELTFDSTQQIYTNIDSSNLFRNLRNLKTIEFENFITEDTTKMSNMFYNANLLTKLNLNKFDTSDVTDMSGMFSGCETLATLDISGFNTKIVQNMSNMFSGCGKLQSLDISNFNTSNVTNMSGMFKNCENLSNLIFNINRFNTSNVTNMSHMFNYCSNLINIDLSGFDTAQVTDMSYMFDNCKKIVTINLNKFNTTQVTNMANMFYNCISVVNIDLSGFNTSQVTNMSLMFAGCIKLNDLKISSNFDTSQVTNMRMMFQRCQGFTTLDLSTFNTSKVTDMFHMFYNASNIKTIYVSEYDETNNTGWTTVAVTSSQGMFSNCLSIIGGNGTVYNNDNIDATYARIDTENFPGYLTNITQKQ